MKPRSRGSEFAKNIRASLRIMGPPSPKSLRADDGGPASPLSGQADGGRRAQQPQPPSPGEKPMAGQLGGLLPPFPFQIAKDRVPVFLVTPPHLRRPGPHSPSVHRSTKSDEGPWNSVPHRGGAEGAREGTPAKRGDGFNCEVTVAVRVRPDAPDSRRPYQLAAVSESERPCLLIEAPHRAKEEPAPGGPGFEAVSERQRQALAQLEKFEKKNNGNQAAAAAGAADAPGNPGGGKPQLSVTVPQYIHGAISTMSTTRKFSNFDHVFDGAASQEDVYRGVSPLVDELLSKDHHPPGDPNVNDLTIIACGHQKTGKSYTLFGCSLDAQNNAGLRKAPSLPKRWSNSHGSRPAEADQLLPSDGLLQRTVAKIIANSAGAISMSFAQVLPDVSHALLLQSIPPAATGQVERVIDLLTGEEEPEMERGTFWDLLAKAPVNALQDVNRRLRDGQRFARDGGYVVISFEFSTKNGSTRRFTAVDTACSETLSVTPRQTVSPVRPTVAVALESLFSDARLLGRKTLLFATVSRRAEDAAQTLATLVSADGLIGTRVVGGNWRRRSQLIRQPSSAVMLKELSSYDMRPSRGDMDPVPKIAPSADADFRASPSEHAPAAVSGGVISDGGRAADDEDVGALRSQLRGEREANRELRRKVEDLADKLAGAEQRLESMRLRELDLMLDVSATQGSLVALGQERDLEHAALQETRAMAAEMRGKWSRAVEELRTLRHVVSGLTSCLELPPAGGGAGGRLAAEALEAREVGEAIASLAARHAEASVANEQLRRDRDETASRLEEVARALAKERRTSATLRVKLAEFGAAPEDVAAASDDETDSRNWTLPRGAREPPAPSASSSSAGGLQRRSWAGTPTTHQQQLQQLQQQQLQQHAPRPAPPPFAAGAQPGARWSSRRFPSSPLAARREFVGFPVARAADHKLHSRMSSSDASLGSPLVPLSDIQTAVPAVDGGGDRAEAGRPPAQQQRRRRRTNASAPSSPRLPGREKERSPGLSAPSSPRSPGEDASVAPSTGRADADSSGLSMSPVDVSLGSPLLRLFDYRMAAASNADGPPPQQQPKEGEQADDASDEAEWEALMQRLDHENGRPGGGGGGGSGGADEQDADSPAAAAAAEEPNSQSEAEWEAMVATFEAEERRLKPVIRHRIQKARISMAF